MKIVLSFKKIYFQDTAISPRLGWFVCFVLPTLGFLFCILLIARDWEQFLVACVFASILVFVVAKLLICCYEPIIHAVYGKKREKCLSELKERWNKSVVQNYTLTLTFYSRLLLSLMGSRSFKYLSVCLIQSALLHLNNSDFFCF